MKNVRCEWQNFMARLIWCKLVYQSWALGKFFKHSKMFSSISMQARDKRDSYDTSWMIKGTLRDVDGFRGISRAKTVGWNLIKTSRVLRGMSRKNTESKQKSEFLDIRILVGKHRELCKIRILGNSAIGIFVPV